MMEEADSFIRLDEVMRITGLPCSTLYWRMARGTFPKSVPLSKARVAWLESEVRAWQRERVAERDAKEVSHASAA